MRDSTFAQSSPWRVQLSKYTNAISQQTQEGYNFNLDILTAFTVSIAYIAVFILLYDGTRIF